MSAIKPLLIIDLEATCHERGQEPPNFLSEIIEFGCVLYDPDEKKVTDEFCTFVQPVRHPHLTPFCTKLTSITQEDVSKAPLIQEAFQKLTDWYDLHKTRTPVFCSWGDYDKKKIKSTCIDNQLDYPFGNQHINLKTEFYEFYQPHFPEGKRFSRPVGMKAALKFLKIQLDGTHHRGIDDARNMAKIAQRMIEDGWEHPDLLQSKQQM